MEPGMSMFSTLVHSPSSRRVSEVRSSVPLVSLGGICGLAWSASLRGWMVQLAGDSSSFTWTGTFLLVLLPGVLAGGLLGWAEGLRRSGGRRGWRWLALAPALFAVAIADPKNFTALIDSGMGGGSLGVVLIGLLGGYALAPRGPVWSRVLTGSIAVIGILGSGFVTGDVQPIATAHGAWAAVYLPSLLVVLCVASSIPHRPTTSAPTPGSTTAEGTYAG
jgi:hypothetical protein